MLACVLVYSSVSASRHARDDDGACGLFRGAITKSRAREPPYSERDYLDNNDDDAVVVSPSVLSLARAGSVCVYTQTRLKPKPQRRRSSETDGLSQARIMSAAALIVGRAVVVKRIFIHASAYEA